MDESTSREKVLKRIRQAHVAQIPNPCPDFREGSDVFHDQDEDPAVLFARQFVENKGQLIFCEGDLDFAEKLVTLCENQKITTLLCIEEHLKKFLLKIDFEHQRQWAERSDINEVLVSCDALIARTGSIVFTYPNPGTIALVANAQKLLVVADVNLIHHNFTDAVEDIKEKNGDNFPEMLHCINGPARNFEIECREIIGGLSALEVYLFLLNRDEE